MHTHAHTPQSIWRGHVWMLIHPLHIWRLFAATHIPLLLLLTTTGTEPKNLTTSLPAPPYPPSAGSLGDLLGIKSTSTVFGQLGSGSISFSLQAKWRSVHRVTLSLNCVWLHSHSIFVRLNASLLYIIYNLWKIIQKEWPFSRVYFGESSCHKAKNVHLCKILKKSISVIHAALFHSWSCV